MKHNKINKSLFTLLTWFLLQAAGTFAFAESIEPANGSNGEQIPTATADKQVNERPNANKQAADSAYMEKAYDKATAILQMHMDLMSTSFTTSEMLTIARTICRAPFLTTKRP